MTLGRVHLLSLSFAVTIALLGMVNGSPLTATAAAIAIVLVWSTAARLQRPKRSKVLAGLVHAATLAGVVFAVGVFRDARIDAVLLVVMLGIANRYVLRAGHRDDLILVGASTVLVAAATTVTPGIGFFFILVTFVPCALWALWAATLLGAAPERRRARAPRHMTTIASWGLFLTLGGFAIVALLPRYHFSRLLSPGYFMQLAGASRSMDLTTGGVRPSSGGVAVMQIEVQPGAGSAMVEGLYARMFALDDFDGVRFEESEGGRTVAVHPIGQNYRGSHREFDRTDGPTVVRVALERLARAGAQHPVATLGRRWPAYAMVRGLRRTESGNWLSSQLEVRTNVVYKVDLSRRSLVAPVTPERRAEQLERLLRLPDDVDPRIVALAEGLVEEERTTDEKIAAVLAHFDDRYTYSLEPLPGKSDNPLVRFLFEAKTGHCELYAGATAVLLRLVGVPARVVTGYYGGRWNDAGGYLEMSSEDAHAWVEVFDEDEGWRWVDATPATERARRRPVTLAWLTDFYKALEKLWYDRVVDFDEQKRRQLVDGVRRKVVSLPVFDGSRGGRGGGSSAATGLVVVALLVVAAFGALWVWRRRSQPHAVGMRLRRVLGGKDDETATLGMLLGRVPEARRAAAREAIALYEAWRFGGESTAGAAPVIAAIRRIDRG